MEQKQVSFEEFSGSKSDLTIKISLLQKLPSRLFFSIMKAIRVKKQLEEKIKIVITNNLIVSLLSSVNSSSWELCLKFSKIMNPNIMLAA